MSNPSPTFPHRVKAAIPDPWKRAWHRGHDTLRSNLFPSLKRLWNRCLDAISTEYHFRFRQQDIQQNLAKQRHLPRGLYIEGTNTCNAKCTFCAYPQMERPKQIMPIEDFRRAIDEYVEMGGKHVAITPIVGDPFVDPHIFDRLDDLHN
ncbi:MAG: radical SAM protein, partial [Geitlerinemataceae cyanobacterium]